MTKEPRPVADGTVGAGRAEFRAKRVRPAYVQVADQLREAILTGQLLPGDRLPIEPDLSALFGVSRSTVREALRLLSSQDLVTTVRGVTGGTFIAQVDPAKLIDYVTSGLGLLSGAHLISVEDLLEARAMIEVPAAALAARNRSDADLTALAECVDESRAVATREEVFGPHGAFHTVLLTSCDNLLLPIAVQPIYSVLRSRFLQPDDPTKFFAKTAAEHEEILDRLRARDEVGAAEAMRSHLAELHGYYSGKIDRTHAEREAGSDALSLIAASAQSTRRPVI